jgi:hypothetical protein
LTRKSITTNPPVVACDVCGRTLLRGESADVFIANGARRSVCELCTGRAVHEGWIREGLDDVMARNRDHRRRGSLLSRLFSGRRSEPQHHEDPYAGPAPARGAEPTAEPELEPERAPAPPPPEPAPVAVIHHHEPTPDQALYEHRSVHGVPTNAELKVARAMELFNASPQIRTVAGVARSLGAPIVSARPSKTEGSVVTIVVAWELSWYRFEVDLGNEAAGVRVAAQGSELSELDTIDQTPNAAADELGRLHPAASLA